MNFHENFNTIITLVNIAQDGEENLITRSQAKRILVGADKFTIVIFDFQDVATIGQAFADEIFRVFANEYPEIKITYVNAQPEVKKMISRAEKLKERELNNPCSDCSSSRRWARSMATKATIRCLITGVRAVCHALF
jgi:STAS-like domain of unknown function (DUF4325)